VPRQLGNRFTLPLQAPSGSFVVGDIWANSGLLWLANSTSTSVQVPVKRQAFTSTTTSVLTSKTTIAQIVSLAVGSYHFRAQVAINNSAANALNTEIDFSGTATCSYNGVVSNISTAGQSFVGGVSAFATTLSSSASSELWWRWEGMLFVTVAGNLTLAGTATTSTKTAEIGAFIEAEKWA
jgi:hypothetical protein